MTISPDDEARIGRAAMFAAASMVGPATLDDLTAVMTPAAKQAGAADLVHFFGLAGPTAPPEALYRHAAAQGWHTLPADGFASIAAPLRAWFECFAVCAQALRLLLDPPIVARDVRLVADTKVAIEDTIFAKSPRGDERTGGHSLAPGQPISTDQVPVIAPAAAAVAAPLIQAAPAPVIAGAVLDDFASGRRPSDAEMMAMSPQERRAYAHLFGLGTFTADFVDSTSQSLVDPPPVLDGETERVAVVGDGVAGSVPVTRAKKAKTAS